MSIGQMFLEWGEVIGWPAVEPGPSSPPGAAGTWPRAAAAGASSGTPACSRRAWRGSGPPRACRGRRWCHSPGHKSGTGGGSGPGQHPLSPHGGYSHPSLPPLVSPLLLSLLRHSSPPPLRCLHSSLLSPRFNRHLLGGSSMWRYLNFLVRIYMIVFLVIDWLLNDWDWWSNDKGKRWHCNVGLGKG